MNRLFIALAALLACTAPASAAPKKPLTIIGAVPGQLQPGDTITLNASTSGGASINIPPGAAPASPANGDCWTTTAGYFCRINGTTINLTQANLGSPNGTLSVANGGTGVTSATANYAFMAPNGSSGAPTFRALVPADVTSLQTGAGAVTKTLDDRIKSEPISIIDFLSSAQLADVKARTASVDVTTPVQNWLAACIAQHRACKAVSGVYKVTGAITFDQAGNLSNGLIVYSDEPGQTVFYSTYAAGVPFKLIASGGSPAAPVSSTYAKLSGIAFQCTYAGACLMIGQNDYSDQINEFVIDRVTVQNFDTTASSTAYEFNAVFSGYVFANGSTAASPGRILTLGAITGGSGYTNGTYTNVALTGSAQGSLATANITVSGGAVTAVTITSGGVLYNVADSLTAVASNIGGTGSGFSVPVATVATVQNDIFRIRQAAFTTFKIGASSGWNFAHITNSFTYGNTFLTPDCEIVANCFKIDSTNAVKNTIVGGQFAYSNFGYGITQTAGSNTVAINPNINATVANFLSSGTSTYAQRWGMDTVAQLASPTFTGTPSINNAAANATLNLTSGAYAGNIFEDTGGNLQTVNTNSGGYLVLSQAGTGTIQFNVNGAQVGALTSATTTINNKLALSGGTPTCGSNCSSIGANSTDQKFSITTSSSVSSATVNFGSAFAVAPKCTASAASAIAVGVSSVSTSAVTFALPASTTTTVYAICVQ